MKKAWIIVPVLVAEGSEQEVQDLANELAEYDPPCKVRVATPWIHWEGTQ